MQPRLSPMNKTNITPARLLKAAASAAHNAYCPYSRFRVGAAVLTEDGRIFAGCNVENASYGLTTCAERNAVAAAVAGGSRRVKAVAIVTGGRAPASPCGACRQVLSEFATPDTVIYSASLRNLGNRKTWLLKSLLPDSFELKPEKRRAGGKRP